MIKKGAQAPFFCNRYHTQSLKSPCLLFLLNLRVKKDRVVILLHKITMTSILFTQ